MFFPRRIFIKRSRRGIRNDVSDFGSQPLDLYIRQLNYWRIVRKTKRKKISGIIFSYNSSLSKVFLPQERDNSRKYD